MHLQFQLQSISASSEMVLIVHIYNEFRIEGGVEQYLAESNLDSS